jgi:tRNA 2-selenouridine synthase
MTFMADNPLDINEFLKKSQTLPVLDVRSPAEFNHGHFPGADNLPLFTNEERSIVGTLYLQKGSKDAMLRGLELIGPRMKGFVQQAMDLAPGGEVLLYCWRGGMRSSSMAWLFNTAGIRADVLSGGYRAYRRFVQGWFEAPVWLIVVAGFTGSGKTEVVEALENRGQQVIHLERLASHKGSVFGSIGMDQQPTTEHFENLLFGCMASFDPQRPVFIEDESLSIGRVFIPRPLYDQMKAAWHIELEVPLAQRLNRLATDYTRVGNSLLVDGIRRLEKRLGYEMASAAIRSIEEGNMQAAMVPVLKYYDKLYARSMGLHNPRVTRLPVVSGNPGEIADQIISLTKT